MRDQKKLVYPEALDFIAVQTLYTTSTFSDCAIGRKYKTMGYSYTPEIRLKLRLLIIIIRKK